MLIVNLYRSKLFLCTLGESAEIYLYWGLIGHAEFQTKRHFLWLLSMFRQSLGRRLHDCSIWKKWKQNDLFNLIFNVKQGTDDNSVGGGKIDDIQISSLLYADNTIDVNSNIINSTVESHQKITYFTNSNSLTLSSDKCFIMIKQIYNGWIPTLKVDQGIVKCVTSTNYLDDIINKKGTNNDMAWVTG